MVSVMLEIEVLPRSEMEQTENESGRTKFSHGVRVRQLVNIGEWFLPTGGVEGALLTW